MVWNQQNATKLPISNLIWLSSSHSELKWTEESWIRKPEWSSFCFVLHKNIFLLFSGHTNCWDVIPLHWTFATNIIICWHRTNFLLKLQNTLQTRKWKAFGRLLAFYVVLPQSVCFMRKTNRLNFVHSKNPNICKCFCSQHFVCFYSKTLRNFGSLCFQMFQILKRVLVWNQFNSYFWVEKLKYDQFQHFAFSFWICKLQRSHNDHLATHLFFLAQTVFHVIQRTTARTHTHTFCVYLFFFWISIYFRHHVKKYFSLVTFLCKQINPYNNASALGGHPGT